MGFRWRPRFDFRRAEVAEIRRMAGWMFGYVLTTQVAFLVTSRVANEAAVRARRTSTAPASPPTATPGSCSSCRTRSSAISVITALLPRMSAHAADRQYALVRDDFSTGVRLSSVIVVPAALILAVLGPPLAEVLLGYGSTSVARAPATSARCSPCSRSAWSRT